LNFNNGQDSNTYKEVDLNDNDQVAKNGLRDDASPIRESALIIDEEVEVGISREDDGKVGSLKAITGAAETIGRKNIAENTPAVKVPWYEWGHHRCAECHSVVLLGSVARHFRTIHDTSVEEYKQKHMIPEAELLIPDYKCLVCGVAVPHTNMNIMNHIKLHKLNFSSYFFQFVKGPGISLKPEVSESIMNSGNTEIPAKNLAEKSQGSKHSKDSSSLLLPEERLDSSACSDIDQQSSSGVKRKSLHPAAPDFDNKRARRSSEYGTLPWYEGSWHKCMECGQVTTMGKFFVSHVKAEHKMDKKKYVDKYPDDEVEISEKWKCEMCGKSIAWSVRSIAAHLSKAHSMSKEDYACRFMDGEGSESDQDVDSDQDLLMVFDKYS